MHQLQREGALREIPSMSRAWPQEEKTLPSSKIHQSPQRATSLAIDPSFRPGLSVDVALSNEKSLSGDRLKVALSLQLGHQRPIRRSGGCGDPETDNVALSRFTGGIWLLLSSSMLFTLLKTPKLGRSQTQHSNIFQYVRKKCYVSSSVVSKFRDCAVTVP